MSKQVVFGKRQLVVATLADRIHNGTLSHGQRLGGEHQLAEEFEVSRGTIRQALGELQRRNLIATESGVGSFVTFDGVALDSSLGWARALADAQTGVRTEIREIVEITRQEIPDLPNDVELDRAIAVRRVRRLESKTGPGQAISFECAAIPAVGSLINLPETGLVDDSIWASLAEVGLRAFRGEQHVTVHALENHEAKILEREPGTAFLRTTRTSYASDGRFVEHVVSLLDPDRFTLQLTFGEKQ